MLVSVVLPAYNAELYLKEAIDSVLSQTFTDFELIILNDGSIDRTEEIILSYNDSRIVYVKNEKNLGLIGTLNKGINLAKGKYIARMDADDICLPERFKKQVDFLEKNNEIDLIGTNAIKINNNGDRIGVINMP
ncbi:TPA: glycosyltransferase family 2 protein, partial [Acinetobacter baumannii]